MPAASVIIRSFNEAEYIEDTLEAVSRQSFQDFEIVLVDSGSTDGTLEIAEDYVDEITFVDPRNFTFGYSLNVGCQAADGDYLVFLSAHAIPTDTNWLGTLVENLYDEDVAMTYSNQTGKGPTKFSEDRLFDELFPSKRKDQRPPDYFANNASSAIKRELWEQHQFDEYLTGHEDIEWAKHFMDSGYTVVYEPDACIYHIHDETWEQVYHRFEREAIADRKIGIRAASERWREYAAIPRDIVGDTLAAIREGDLDSRTFRNILQFRYYQHTGTANGLQKEHDLEANRYEYFYPNANEQLQVERSGELTITESSLPEIRPNDVLIEVEYAGVMKEDVAALDGDADTYPLVPGREYVGRVAELGANVESLDIDDRVTGGSVFHCGVCQACDKGRYAACENRVELGTVDHDGAFSRFLTVPSNHVHRLPDAVSTECAPLAGPLSSILDGLSRAEQFGAGEDERVCVVGNGLLAELTGQFLEKEGYTWCAVDEAGADQSLESCQLIIVTPGVDDNVNTTVQRASPGSTIVILETEHEDTTIEAMNLAEKALVTVERRGESQFDRALDVLASGDYDTVLNGRYSVEEFVSDPTVARSENRLSLVDFDAPVSANHTEQ